MPDLSSRVTIDEAAPAGQGEWVVNEGETLDGIAAQSGHFRETLRTLPANETLMAARAGGATLLPGDRLTVPPIRPKEQICATGKRHVFRRRGVPAELRFVVRKPDGTAFAGKAYTITVGSRTYDGTTDGEGKIHAWVEPLAQNGTLVVTLDDPDYAAELRRTVSIGTLWPIETVRGVQQRLNALRFHCGEAAGVMNGATSHAVGNFQKAQGVEQSAAVDQATIDALRKVYGF
jgi:hypothetical protein